MFVLDLEKARALKRRKFIVTTRHGRTYERYFKRVGDESAIAAARLFAVRHGSTFEEVDQDNKPVGSELKPKLFVHNTTESAEAAHGESKPGPASEEREVENVMAERQNVRVRIAYSRIGDALARLDPEGYKLARQLQKQDEEIAALTKEGVGVSADEATPDAAQVREAAEHGKGVESWEKLAAAKKERARISASLLSRPLAEKLVRVVAIESEIRELRREQKRREKSDEWSAKWEAQKAATKKLLRNAKRAGRPAKVLKMFPDLQERVNALKRKLKFIRGKSHRIQKFATKTDTLRIITDPGAMERFQAQPGEVSFLLSEGKWPFKDENGGNVFTKEAAKNLWDEWSGIVSNIVAGRVQRGKTGTDWKHIVPDFKNVKDDLISRAKNDLLEMAKWFTPEKAERSKGFKAFAIFSLTKNVNQELLAYLRYSKGKRHAKDEALGELEDFLTSDDPIAAGGSDVMREAAPLESRYVTPEENVILKEGIDIMSSRIGATEIQSVLEALNIVDRPDNRTAKQKAAALANTIETEAVRKEARRRLAALFPENLDVGEGELAAMAEKSPAHRKALERWTRLKNIRSGLWVDELSPSERRAAWASLQLLNKIADQRTLATVGTTSWRRLKSKPGTKEVDRHEEYRLRNLGGDVADKKYQPALDSFYFKDEHRGEGHMKRQRHVNPLAAGFWAEREKEFPGTLESLGLTPGYITGFEGQSGLPTKIRFEHEHIEPALRRGWAKLVSTPSAKRADVVAGLKIDADEKHRKAANAFIKKLGLTADQFTRIADQLARTKTASLVKSLTRGVPSKVALKALWRKLVDRAIGAARGSKH